MAELGTISEATAQQISTLNPQAREAAKATFAKHYSTQEIERVFGGGASAGGAPTPTMPLKQTPSADPLVFDYTQRLTGYRKLYQVGSATMRQEVIERATREGLDLKVVTGDQTFTAPAKAAPNEAAQLNAANKDTQVNAGPYQRSPATVEAYHLKFDRQLTADLDPDEVANLHSMFGNAMMAAGIPEAMGNSLVQACLESAEIFEDLDDAQDELRQSEEAAKFHRLQNADQLAADAEFAYSKLPADFQKVADDAKFFHSARAYALLANIGAMMKRGSK